MRKYKEAIAPTFPVILKKYFFFYAIPCILLLPITVKVVMGLFLNIPHYSDSLLHMYLRCYTSSFLFFVIPVLLFLFWIAYSNSVVNIVIKNDRLFLPIKTGVYNDGLAVTIIPLKDIVSIKLKQHNIQNLIKSHPLQADKNEGKKYVISCYDQYQGDWVIVNFIRPKKSISRLFASLGGDARSYEHENIYIEFPTENFKEIHSIIGK